MSILRKPLTHFAFPNLFLPSFFVFRTIFRRKPTGQKCLVRLRHCGLSFSFRDARPLLAGSSQPARGRRFRARCNSGSAARRVGVGSLDIRCCSGLLIGVQTRCFILLSTDYRCLTDLPDESWKTFGRVFSFPFCLSCFAGVFRTAYPLVLICRFNSE